MKRYGALIALVLAVGCGLLAVVLANKWLSARSKQIGETTAEVNPSVRVVVAAKDLNIGTPLSAENVVLTEWPKASVPKGAFHAIEEIKDRTVLSRLWAGEPVMAVHLAAPGSGAGMVATIAPGMRAMAVKVDEVSGVGGFILPYTYVDVIAVDGDNKAKSVKTLLNRIKVLAIAQETFTEDGKPKIVKTVTLELEPKEAENLALQMSDGGIYLALRNPLDESEPVFEPVKTIVRRPQRPVYKPVPAPAPEPRFEVEVIRRSKRESLNFKGDGSDESI
jgi:pilus assembly protein CpaB